VQGIRAERDNTGTTTARQYLLAGLLRCGIRGRRLESCWANNRPAYRCRHGYTSAITPDPARPKNTYVRKDYILPRLPALHARLSAAISPAARRRRRTRAGIEVARPGGRRHRHRHVRVLAGRPVRPRADADRRPVRVRWRPGLSQLPAGARTYVAVLPGPVMVAAVIRVA